MEYIVTSLTKLGDKEFGEIFTEKELLDVGANIDVLIAAGSIKKVIPATQVRQAPQVSDFKSTNNTEGDK